MTESTRHTQGYHYPFGYHEGLNPSEFPGYPEAAGYYMGVLGNPGWFMMMAADNEVLVIPAIMPMRDPEWRMAAIAPFMMERRWDSRKGDPRHTVAAQKIDADPSAAAWQLTFEGADMLGNVRSTSPQNPTPTLAVVLGGRGKAFENRARYLVEKLANFENLVLLGSSRAVDDAERKLIPYGSGVEDEAGIARAYLENVLRARLVSSFKAVADPEAGGIIYGVYEYTFEWHGITKKATVLSTPPDLKPGDKVRNSTSRDNFQVLAQWAGLADHPEISIVGATTALYRLFQEITGVEELTLKFGTRFEMIGHDASWGGVTRKASELRQEMIAAWDALTHLRETLLAI